MTWISEFAKGAASTDHLDTGELHSWLLAAGLMGEAGSILSEEKKKLRDGAAYSAYSSRLCEEMGDFLWYYVRLVTILDPELLSELDSSFSVEPRSGAGGRLASVLGLGAAAGKVLTALEDRAKRSLEARPLLEDVWTALVAVSHEVQIPLEVAAHENRQKVSSRWPSARVPAPLFDEKYPQEEQLPRHLCIDFREHCRGKRRAVSLHWNGSSVGDSLTDNIRDADGYRFHDVFHFAHAAYLGWSPVTRALLRCKRKSNPEIDEAEDGARAGVLEEAITAMVFSRAKRLNFFQGIAQLDYDLLKTVKTIVQGYEVDSVPLWQWEEAILEGYRVFRQLRVNAGGQVTLDLVRRRLDYGNSQGSSSRSRRGPAALDIGSDSPRAAYWSAPRQTD